MKNLKKLIISFVLVIILLVIILLVVYVEWRYNEYYVFYSGYNIEIWNYYGIYIDEWVLVYYKGYVDSLCVFYVDYGVFDYYCGLDGVMKIGWF